MSRLPSKNSAQDLLVRLGGDKLFPAQRGGDVLAQLYFGEPELLQDIFKLLALIGDLEFDLIDLGVDLFLVDLDVELQQVLVNQRVVHEVVDDFGPDFRMPGRRHLIEAALHVAFHDRLAVDGGGDGIGSRWGRRGSRDGGHGWRCVYGRGTRRCRSRRRHGLLSGKRHTGHENRGGRQGKSMNGGHNYSPRSSGFAVPARQLAPRLVQTRTFTEIGPKKTAVPNFRLQLRAKRGDCSYRTGAETKIRACFNPAVSGVHDCGGKFSTCRVHSRQVGKLAATGPNCRLAADTSPPHPTRIASFISRTARSMPTRMAREMMLWPMFSSSRPGMWATAWTLV